MAGVFLMCLLEARPVVQVMFLLRFTCGVVLAEGVLSFRVAIGALAWAASCFAIYLLNGVTDLGEDSANGSVRPVARGALAVNQARGTAIAAGVLGIVLANACGQSLEWAVDALLFLGYCYSGPPFQLKRHVPGESVTGTGLVVLSIFAGYSCVPASPTPRPETFVFVGAVALWTGLVGQSKDLPDLEGDALAGRRTLPCLLGERQARLVLAMAALALSLGFVLLARMVSPVLMYGAISMMLGAVAVAIALLTHISAGGRMRRRRPYRLFMVTQYLTCVLVIAARARGQYG